MGYNIKKLKLELKRSNTNNFNFELENNNIFNEEKFHQFIENIVEFVNNYPELLNLPEKEYFYYMSEIIKICEDTLWAFTKHLLPDNEYEIKNFEEIKDRLTEYYMYIRQYSEMLILNVQE